MQVLYVVELDVALRDPYTEADTAYPQAVAGVARWLSWIAGETVASETLHVEGEQTLPPSHQGSIRSARWEVVEGNGNRAVRIHLRNEHPDGRGSFLTRVTVGETGAAVTVRISMARESEATWLSPVPPADLRQPKLIKILLDDERLAVSVDQQIQDGRYLSIRADAEVDALADALLSDTRLPIVLIHTRTLPALATARTAAAKLVGLVRVVTLDLRASKRMGHRLPALVPPYAGARLIWSDSAAPNVAFDAEHVNGEDEDWLRGQLMRRVAPVSVLARGLDRAYRSARQAELSARQQAARLRTEQADAAGDQAAQLTALREEVNALQTDVAGWEELAIAAEDEAAALRTQVPDLEQRNEQLTVALRAAQLPTSMYDQTDPWAALPMLRQGNEDSARNLFLQLSDLSEGKIVFTDRAATSWKKADYPYPEEMRDDLVQLTKVAITLYDGTERNLPHLADWIRTEFNLKVSLQDDTIEKNRAMRQFEYESVTYERTPHVKVRDAAPHQHVGRIHFALDPRRSRIVVDHVATKLY